MSVSGGYILVPRNNPLADAPPHAREIYDWLCRNANFKDHTKIPRGSLLTRYSEILEGLSWKVGYRKVTYKKHHCETAMKLLVKRNMVTTTKTTRGMIVTICDYNRMQDPKSYETYTEADSENHNKTTREPHGKGKNGNERKEGNNKNNGGDDLIIIPLVDGSEYTITEEYVDELSKTFPSVDTKRELTMCAQWNKSNKAKRKTKSGIKRHVFTWLSKAYEKQCEREDKKTHGRLHDGFSKRNYTKDATPTEQIPDFMQ